jgi:argininosuccinate lyase
MAWANGLCSIAYLTPDEVEKINETLGVAMELIEKDKFDGALRDEDIHMNLERFCTERLGILGKKMHYGRSRNDLIATTLRLFVRDNIAGIKRKTKRLPSLRCQTSLHTVDILIPGMTHVQMPNRCDWLSNSSHMLMN